MRKNIIGDPELLTSCPFNDINQLIYRVMHRLYIVDCTGSVKHIRLFSQERAGITCPRT